MHSLSLGRCRYPRMKTFLVAMVMLGSRGYAEPASLSSLTHKCGVHRVLGLAQLPKGSDPVVMGAEADDAEPMPVPHSRHHKRREMQGGKCRFGR
jgi:hypothetical protein